MRFLTVAGLIASTQSARVEEKYSLDVNVTDQSPFEAYAAASEEKNCPPAVFRSKCPDSQFKGIVLFFHGYSSCSIQAAAFAPEVTAKCMDVIAPTHPGHGDSISDCPTEESCSVSHQGKGWTHARLPTHRNGYVTYANAVAAVAKQELTFRQTQTGVSTAEPYIAGLSFGCPLALHVVQQNQGYFQRMLMMNPYFALGDEVDDEKSDECETLVEQGKKTQAACTQETINMRLAPMGLTADSAVTKMIFGASEETVVKNFFETMAAMSDRYGNRADLYTHATYGAALKKQVVWPGNCPGIIQNNKGGFCAFRNAHYLASHSFAMRAIVEAHSWGEWRRGTPETQFILTERDGMSRNGVTWALARHLKAVEDQEGEIDMCMYRFKKGTKRSDPAQYWNDANSLPHAFLQPKGKWWDFIYNKIAEYLNADKEQLMDSTLASWDGSVKQCVSMPLTSTAMTDYPELDDIFFEGVTPTSTMDLQWNYVLSMR